MQPDEQKMEQWLDSALRQYGAGEARPGLEERISARLHAERQAKTHERKWWVLAGSMAAAAVIAAFWVGRSVPDRTPRKTAVTNSAALRAPVGPGTQSVQLPPTAASGAAARERRRRKADHLGSTVGVHRLPRLVEFPSREMSAQYKLLAAYVERTPRDELKAVIAQQKSSSDLQIKDLEIAPLSDEGVASGSEDRN